MRAMDDLADRLDAAAAALQQLGPAVIAGEPWPLTDVYGPGPESAWGPREVLAHVGEMLPFWMGEIELIVDAAVDAGRAAAGAEPPGFGRLETDPIRIEVIGRDRTFPARELLSRVMSEADRVAARFRSLTDAEAASLGRHVTRGDLAVSAVAQQLIVGHIEGHVAQLRESLAGSR